MVDAGDRGLISQIDETAGIPATRRSRQKAREIQKARVFPATLRRLMKSAGNPATRRRSTESAGNPATWRRPRKSAEIQRSDVDRRRGSPRERRRLREIEER